MKYILKFNDLFESVSAASHERSGWDYPPFKFAKNFDPRVGYSKKDFCRDLRRIYLKLERPKKSGLMKTIFSISGMTEISQIENLPNSKVDSLMRAIEEFLESKVSDKLKILPDGFILCYENIKDPENRRVDIYYSPVLKIIRISYTDEYPETREEELSLEEFRPFSFKIDPKEFKKTIDKCDSENKEL